jgi:hypothetical protein
MASSGRKLGRTLSNGPPEGQPWCWMTKTQLASLTMRALGISARRILDALMVEHMAHGGKANGNLAATYEQLSSFGVTPADVRKGLAELIATGFIRQTKQGLFAMGGRIPSRYALTWLPTGTGPDAGPPTHDWLTVIERLQRDHIATVPAVKKWLRVEVAAHARGEKRT